MELVKNYVQINYALRAAVSCVVPVRAALIVFEFKAEQQFVGNFVATRIQTRPGCSGNNNNTNEREYRVSKVCSRPVSSARQLVR